MRTIPASTLARQSPKKCDILQLKSVVTAPHWPQRTDPNRTMCSQFLHLKIRVAISVLNKATIRPRNARDDRTARCW
jgi:hypothetical protein